MHKLILVLLGLSLSGCSTVGVTRLKDSPPRAKNCEIQIFSDASTVKQPYEELCLLDSRTGSTAFHDKTAAGAIANAKGEACRCGADAIIVGNMGMNGASFNSWGNGTAIMKAIRFKDSK